MKRKPKAWILAKILWALLGFVLPAYWNEAAFNDKDPFGSWYLVPRISFRPLVHLSVTWFLVASIISILAWPAVENFENGEGFTWRRRSAKP